MKNKIVNKDITKKTKIPKAGKTIKTYVMKTLKLNIFLLIFFIICNVIAQEKKDLCKDSLKSFPFKTLGGVDSDGNLEVQIYDNANMQVNRYIYGVWMNQWYGTCSKSTLFCADSVVYSGDGCYYSGASVLFNTISNTNIDDNTNELVLEKSGKLRIKQITYYPPGSAEIHYTWKITNISSQTINDLRLFTGGDTYLQLDDNGAGYWNSSNNTVGVEKMTGSNLQKLSIQGITTPYAYESRYYWDVYRSVTANALTNAIDGNEGTDNGMALEFRKSTLDAGDTWNIETIEKFSAVNIPNIIVTAPPSGQIKPGKSEELTFSIKNLQPTPTTVTLIPTIDLTGWKIELISPSSPLNLLPYEIQNINIKVTCPDGTPLGIVSKVKLDATDLSGTASDSTNLTVIDVPEIIVNPVSQNICQGLPAYFNISAINADNFQWQEYRTGWRNIIDSGIYHGTNSSILDISEVTDSMNNYQYRCILNNTYGKDTSNNAILTINDPPLIITNPSSSFICEGNNTNFEVVASGTGLFYRWQVNNGSGFYDILDNKFYNGTNSSTLFISDADYKMNGFEYKCIVSGTCSPNDTSDAAILTVYKLPDVILGNDTLLCENQTITLDAGPGINYVWSNPLLSGQIVTIDTSIAGMGTHVISVSVTNTDNCVGSDSIKITYSNCNGINIYNQNPSITIMPNPTSGLVFINFNETVKEAEIEILNMQGIVIKKEKVIDNGKTQIDLSDVPKGVYMIEIKTNNKIVIKKLILN